MTTPNLSPVDDSMSLYSYNPSVPAAVTGAVIFSGFAVLHTCLLTRYRAWVFWAFYLGVVLEFVGFTARATSVRSDENATAFLTAYGAILIAPSFMAAGCYITFHRIVWLVTHPDNHRFSVLWSYPRFANPALAFFGIAASFIELLGICALGTKYSRTIWQSEPPLQQLGITALKVGLVAQLCVLGAFHVLCVRFCCISWGWTTPLSRSGSPGMNWRQLIWAINIATWVISARTAYRLAELIESTKPFSYLAYYEWPFWVFDTLPMLAILFLFGIVYPGAHLPLEFRALFLKKKRVQSASRKIHLTQGIELTTDHCNNGERSPQQNWV